MHPKARLALWVAILAAVAAFAAWHRIHTEPVSPASASRAATEAVTRAFLELEAREAERDRTVWGEEVEAEASEDVLVAFWDELNASGHAWETFGAHAPDSFHFSTNHTSAPPGFTDLADSLPSGRLKRGELLEWLAGLRDTGWQVRRSRWEVTHHVSTSRHSWLHFEILAENQRTHSRAQIRGGADVKWTRTEPLRPDDIEVTGVAAWGQTGPTRFVVEADIDLPVPPHTPFVDPLLAITDARGTTDLALVGAGVRLRRDPSGHWVSSPSSNLPEERLWAATLADWDGDGADDLILVGSTGVRVVKGPAFDGPGETVWNAPTKLNHPQVVAAGDYDGDGRLDLWIGQYKLPYQGGQFPTPVFNANDGFPSYLLHREGPSTLRDTTEESGLGTKRWRRVYSGSFVDLDGDGKLDLVVASDFSGLDVFMNAGNGKFREPTPDPRPLAFDRSSRYAFGMAHATGDFNEDGRTDVFMTGMVSALAERLDAMYGIYTFGKEPEGALAGAMSGNRMFSGTADGLRLAPWGFDLMHAGWAWAVTPLDFDNDGHLDFHIANGHETRASTRDYERQFWRHDVYVGKSTNNPVVDLYFRNAAGRRAADKASYGGWQHGALFHRERTDKYPDVGWLEGTSVFADTRNAVAADFDGDGRIDLAITTFEDWPVRRQRLVVLRNVGTNANHWVGFRFDGCSSVNATVRVTTSNGVQQRRVASGESFRSQSVGAVHFGLGNAAVIQRAEVLWPDGTVQDLGRVAADRWSTIRREAASRR